jgi:hypothetical protein
MRHLRMGDWNTNNFVHKRHWPALAAIGAFLAENAGTIGAVGSAVGGAASAGTGIANAVRGTPKPQAAAPSTPAPTAMPQTAGAPTGAAPSTSPGDFKAQESAYWQNLLGSTGQSQPGGSLPEPLQQSIEKQASMLG